MCVLGIEGTAWAASAAMYDDETGALRIETDPYEPDSGGIHPREAAEHMAEAIPTVIERILETDGEPAANGGAAINAVAFSWGPGLGPCLRIVASAARTLALSLDVPLVGVNHMIAHAEIGRRSSGFEAPICLNASGANAHVLGYRNGTYRVLGETMDTGVGNALDKFARHLGWSHPGGPRIEAASADGTYVELPYVVKGMDFSFSGLTSAATELVEEGCPVADVCFSLQETIFAMLTEVAERALSLTDADELVLGGGVGQNERLQEMLAAMCEGRDADFHAPEPRLLRDNAGMIAVLGAAMYAAGDHLAVEESRVRPKFRPDDVPVSWPIATPQFGRRDAAVRGAEAVVEFEGDRVVKRRHPKSYRHPALDDRLRRERTILEARLTSAARRQGVPTPVVEALDAREGLVAFERVGDADLRDLLDGSARSPANASSAPPPEPDPVDGDTVVCAVGRYLATLHGAGIVHGDPTTRNVRVAVPADGSGADSSPPDGPAPGTDRGSSADRDPKVAGATSGRAYVIDFGLGFYSGAVEDHAMDLHVFARSIEGTADDPERLHDSFERAYREAGDPTVIDRLREIERRGRYQ